MHYNVRFEVISHTIFKETPLPGRILHFAKCFRAYYELELSFSQAIFLNGRNSNPLISEVLGRVCLIPPRDYPPSQAVVVNPSRGDNWAF